MKEKEKKVPKVWEKIVFKLYWSTVQVLITQCRKIESGYRYRWRIKCYDERRRIWNFITIEWKVDEYWNYWC